MSLKRKGLLALTLILLPLLISFAFISIRIAEKQILKSEAERVSLITEIVRNGLVTIMVEGRGKDIKGFLDNLVAEDIEGIYILGKEGNVISSTASPVLDRRLLDQIRSRPWKGNNLEMLPAKINEKDIYSSILPIYNERTCQRCHGSREDIRAILHVEVSRAKTISKMKNLRYQIAILTGLIFLLSMYLFYRFGLKNLLRPINQMNEALRERAGTDSLVDMDELQILKFHVSGLARDTEWMTREIELLKSKNVELLERIEAIKMKIKGDVLRPLLKITAAIEAFSEGIEGNPEKEILRTIISELKRLEKTLEGDLNKP